MTRAKASKTFNEIFGEFLRQQQFLKVIHVASCRNSIPNSAPKMLVLVKSPNCLFFLDYRFTVTFKNISKNPKASISFMDDTNFVGYRLTGKCAFLKSGREYESIKGVWKKKVASYLADRMVKRLRGEFSAKIAEESLPENFVIVRFLASEAALVKPDRVLRTR